MIKQRYAQEKLLQQCLPFSSIFVLSAKSIFEDDVFLKRLEIVLSTVGALEGPKARLSGEAAKNKLMGMQQN